MVSAIVALEADFTSVPYRVVALNSKGKVIKDWRFGVDRAEVLTALGLIANQLRAKQQEEQNYED